MEDRMATKVTFGNCLSLLPPGSYSREEDAFFFEGEYQYFRKRVFVSGLWDFLGAARN